jgi:cobalt-zinc-cadmium efflux system outer membrane protein
VTHAEASEFAVLADADACRMSHAEKERDDEMERAHALSIALICLATALAPPPSRGEGAPASGTLTLRDALAAALAGNAELRAAQAAIRSQEGLALQANMLPNPALELEVENIGGSGERQSFETTETTLRLLQLVELGGKRAKRLALAERERDASQWTYEAVRAALLADTARAFVDVLALQERLELAAATVRMAEESAGAVEAQVRAGAEAPAETLRARVQTEQARLREAQLRRALAAARIALARQWGESEPSFPSVAGDLDRLREPPPLDALLARIEQVPEVARWSTELAGREAALALEQARAVPDVTLGAGPRYFSDNDDVALVVEAALPLPLIDRNQGAIAAARARIAEADDARRASQIAARAALARGLEELRGAYERAGALRDSILPAAEAARRRTADAYRAGAVRALDLIDAERTLFELQDERVQALADYHRALVDVERLAGMPIGEAR